MNKIEAYGYFLTAANLPWEKRTFVIDSVGPDDAVVEVAGCGLCHTDLSFATGQVQTKHPLPLVLGHEISGTVVASGHNHSNLIGKKVIVPAVLPCGECVLCKSGRDNICQQQKMPGNDFNGGFASHLSVPAKDLCLVPDDIGNYDLATLSVVADAVTTPYQSLLRSKLAAGDMAIVIGSGGIGMYMVQHANNAGATVIALDIDDRKLETAIKMGAAHTINVCDLGEKELRQLIRTLVKENNLPKYQWRIFETSGTAAGQNTAFSLINFAGSLGIIGFTMEKVTVRLSNVMAFDADLFGNWGCSPKHYPAVLDLVLKGRINIKDNVVGYTLEKINDIVPQVLEHKILRRVVLFPEHSRG